MFLLIQGFFNVSCFSSEDEYKRLGGSSTTQICAQNIYLFILLLNDLIDNTVACSYVVNGHNLACSQYSQNFFKNVWEGDKASFILSET